MRKIVLQMMTNLSGKLDDPMAFVGSVSDDHYRAIEALYQRYDTELIGRNTYDEMVAYWPEALRSGEGTETNRVMAQHMHDNEKLVFSRKGDRPLAEWHNSRQIVAPDDVALRMALLDLKARPGGPIHLAGGASLARSVIRLGLVDEYRLFVYPNLVPGISWLEPATGRNLRLVDVEKFEDGAVGLAYEAIESTGKDRPGRFTEMLS